MSSKLSYIPGSGSASVSAKQFAEPEPGEHGIRTTSLIGNPPDRVIHIQRNIDDSCMDQTQTQTILQLV